jgi:hypothetical protein
MGQQQLLLIVLGVIIVGIAIILGIVLFQQNAIDQKRDLLINEGLNVANNAIEYYHKHPTFAGGGFSFEGWQIPSQMLSSGNGDYTYSVDVSSDQVEIIGTGNELVSGTELIEVKFIVRPASIETFIIH